MENKVAIRPIIPNTDAVAYKNEAERFQNGSLRPILKLQHDLLLAFFQQYAIAKKKDLSQMDALKKKTFLEERFKNDIRLKTELRGLIIGHFTVAEYTTYRSMTKEINKRISTMIKERLLSAI